MNWLKIANNSDDVENAVKHKIQTSPFFINLFRSFHIPMSALNTLKIRIKRLDGNFCEAGESEILVDDRLASDPDFLGKDFHFMAHEVLHWLHRQKEKQNYFADPEEVEGFSTGIAYALFIGRTIDDIASQFLPLIKITIKDDIKAKAFLQQRLGDAANLLKKLGL